MAYVSFLYFMIAIGALPIIDLALGCVVAWRLAAVPECRPPTISILVRYLQTCFSGTQLLGTMKRCLRFGRIQDGVVEAGSRRAIALSGFVDGFLHERQQTVCLQLSE